MLAGFTGHGVGGFAALVPTKANPKPASEAQTMRLCMNWRESMTMTLMKLRGKMLALREQEAKPRKPVAISAKRGKRSLRLPTFQVPVLGTIGDEGKITWKPRL